MFRCLREKRRVHGIKSESVACLVRNQFRIISIIFSMFGVDIKGSNNLFNKYVVNWILNKLAIFMHLYMFFRLVFETVCKKDRIILHGEYKRYISIYILTLVNFIPWIIVNKSKKNIANLVEQVEQQIKNFQITAWIPFDIFFIVSNSIMLFFSIAVIKNDSTNAYTSCMVEDPKQGKYYYMIISLNFVAESYTQTFIGCIAVLCATFCAMLQKVILKYVQENTQIIRSKNSSNNIVVSRLLLYETLLKLLKSFECIMSVPMFFVTIFYSTGMFFALYQFFKSVNEYNLMETFIYLSSDLLLFGILLMTAAKVNEADSLAKESNREMLRNLVITNISELDVKMNFLQEINKSSFSLNACGCFNFTRSLLLTAVGTILTYVLLCINI